MLIRKYSILPLLIAATMLGVACSSDQDAIDRAVQQTVEAQRAIDSAVAQTVEAQRVAASTVQPATATPQATNVAAQSELATATTQPTVATVQVNDVQATSAVTPSVSDNSVTGSQALSGPIEDILGVWNGKLSTIGLDRTYYAVLDLVFYPDVVDLQLVHYDSGDLTNVINRYSDIYYYEFADVDTIHLKPSPIDEAMATINIAHQSPTSIEATMSESNSQGQLVGSLNKVADVEIETVGAVQDAMTGWWESRTYPGWNFGFLGDLFVGYHLEQNKLAILYLYEFAGPNSILTSTVGTVTNAEIRVPNSDTILIWSPPKRFGASRDEVFILERLTEPDDVTILDDDVLFPFYVAQGARCGYIDYTGVVVVEPRFRQCLEFSDGLAGVQPFEQWAATGYIDNSGEFAIGPLLGVRSWESFSEGLVAVRHWDSEDKDKNGYIDKTGEYVISGQYGGLSRFSEGLARVDTDDPKWSGFIDTTGTVVFEIDPSWHTDSDGFSEGLLWVKAEGFSGYIDKTGQLAISLEAGQRGRAFSQGLAAVNESPSGCYYIDTNGHTVLQTDYNLCGEFSEDLAFVYRYEPWGCGYIDKSGGLVIDLRFNQCHSFSEGRAVVEVGDYFGVIDTQGNYVFSPYEFDRIYDYRDGLAEVKTVEGNTGYIDRNGDFVLQP